MSRKFTVQLRILSDRVNLLTAAWYLIITTQFIILLGNLLVLVF